MNFSHALEEIKRGRRMARRGWKNARYVGIVNPPLEPTAIAGSIAKALGEQVGHRIQFNRYIVVRNADDSVNPWEANTFDIMQNDWIEYED